MARTRALTLQAADRPTLAAVAAAVGASDETVARWRNCYLA